MFIYLYTLDDYDGSSNAYLCHPTITPDEFEALIERLEQEEVPNALMREKELKERMRKWRLERLDNDQLTKRRPRTKRDDDQMREWIELKYQSIHELREDDVYHAVLERLRTDFGFTDYHFDRAVRRSANTVITTFKMTE
jgi:hypothetical protein